MILKNGTVLNDSFHFEKTNLEICGTKIGAIVPDLNGAQALDVADCYVIPGLIDTHMHGAVNRTFYDPVPDTTESIASFEAKNGTTTLVPAISAAPEDHLTHCIRYLVDATKKPLSGCAEIAGIHLEGPYFSEKYNGAHLPENIRYPNLAEFERLYEAAEGKLKILTLAPELPGAEEVVRFADSHGVRVSAGHTNATAEEIDRSAAWGVRQGTHLYNAMRPLHHREPGTVGALLDGDFQCELIADFIHSNKKIVHLTYKIKGSDLITLITDCEFLAGLPEGDYFLRGRRYAVKDGKILTEDGTIAGGSTCLITGVRNLVSLGVPLEEAVKMAAKNPALAVGIYLEKGSISTGKTADLVVLDRELAIRHVIVRGELLF